MLKLLAGTEEPSGGQDGSARNHSEREVLRGEPWLPADQGHLHRRYSQSCPEPGTEKGSQWKWAEA